MWAIKPEKILQYSIHDLRPKKIYTEKHIVGFKSKSVALEDTKTKQISSFASQSQPQTSANIPSPTEEHMLMSAAKTINLHGTRKL